MLADKSGVIVVIDRDHGDRQVLEVHDPVDAIGPGWGGNGSVGDFDPRVVVHDIAGMCYPGIGLVGQSSDFAAASTTCTALASAEAMVASSGVSC